MTLVPHLYGFPVSPDSRQLHPVHTETETHTLTALPADQHLPHHAVARQLRRLALTPAELVVGASKVEVELLPVDGLPQGPDGLPEPLLRAPAHAGEVAALC